MWRSYKKKNTTKDYDNKIFHVNHHKISRYEQVSLDILNKKNNFNTTSYSIKNKCIENLNKKIWLHIFVSE